MRKNLINTVTVHVDLRFLAIRLTRSYVGCLRKILQGSKRK